jgi:hypothetical protein
MVIQLPQSDYPLLIRTNFSDDAKWDFIVNQVNSPANGYDPAISFINNREYEGLTIEQLPRFKIDQEEQDFIFLADAKTMSHNEGAILCIDLADNFGTSFRVLPECISEVANNLFIANCDFEDFQNTTASDGIYRGS